MEDMIKLMTQNLKLKDIYPESEVRELSEKYGVEESKLALIRKGYVPSKSDIQEGERAIISYITTAAKDRDREIVLPEGGVFDDFLKHSIVLFCHDYKELPVGKAEWLKSDNKGIIGKTIYARTPKANEVYEYRKDGFPLAESIGFMPLEYVEPNDERFNEVVDGLIKRGAIKRAETKDVERIYTKWSLLEYSDVPVPSNPEAIEIAIAKGLIPINDVVTKPEETEDFIHIPVRECNITATIDISKKEGIKAKYCGEEKKVGTYMFDKNEPYNWTMERAKKWVEDHKQSEPKQETYDCECIECGYKMESEKHCKDIKCPKCGGQMRRVERPGPGEEAVNVEDGEHQEREVSQAQIKDELDYIKSLIAQEDMNEEVETQAWEVVREIMGIPGSQIPVDILEKVGAVLNAKNMERLDKIIETAQAIKDSAKKPEPEPEKESIEGKTTIVKEVEEINTSINTFLGNLDRLRGKVD